MSLNVDGNDLTALKRQPAGDTLVEQENGSFVARVVYVCLWSLVYQLIPRKNQSTHPDFPNLLCSDAKATKGEGGVAKITATYSGVPEPGTGQGGGASPEPVEEMVGSLSQEPIESHIDFNDSQNPLNTSDNGAIVDPVTFDFIRFGKHVAGVGVDLQGVDSYLDIRQTYSLTSVSVTKPTSVANVGKIDTPPDPPALAAGRDWLKTGHTWRRSGGVYEVSEQWMSSGRKGWSTSIYETA